MSKQRLTISGAFCLVLLVAGLGFQAPEAHADGGVLNGQIVVDPLSGVAIDGYDAVSYFTEDTPLPGQPEFDFYWQGVPWYFASAANRDVFARAAQIYAPVFGGYGVMSLSRGYLSAGNPRLYAVLGGRLFLFHSQGNRDAFLVSPREAYLAAQEQWQILSPGLAAPGQ